MICVAKVQDLVFKTITFEIFYDVEDEKEARVKMFNFIQTNSKPLKVIEYKLKKEINKLDFVL